MFSEHKWRTGLMQHACDLANILKAFIGSNFLSIPFGFSHCGLLLGVVGMVCIAVLTAHCCLLLVTCKHKLLHHIIAAQEQHHTTPDTTPDTTPNQQTALPQNESCKTDAAHVTNGGHPVLAFRDFQKVHDRKKELQNRVPFRARGKSPTNNPGSSTMPALEEDAKTLTEQDLATTESDFTVKEFPGSDMNAAHDSSSPTFGHSSYRRLAKNIQYGDVARTCLGYWGIVVVNTAIIITQLGFCVNYIIFTSNAFSAFFPVYNCTVTADCANHTVRVSPDCAESVTWRRWQDGDPDNGTNGDLTVSSNQSSSSDFEYSLGFDNVTGGVFASPSSTGTASTCGQLLKEVWSSAPDLQLMVMAPTLVCILLVLVRNLRRLGLVSAVGNLALLAGALLVLGLLIASFQLSDSWVVSQVTGLPTFVSMTASALEGIGTVLPIEASMAENRHNFPVFLLAGLTIVVVVDVGVSVLGYLSFGSSTAQIITLNLQAASPPGVAVNAFLLVGVMLTFPLMAFPVVQLVEKTFFRNDKLCECEVKDPEQLSLLKDQEATNKACDQHHSKASPWKRSLLRVVLVLLVAGLAVVLRNNFAYVAAFTGAVGSITLAYTLPCIFHLQMCWSELSVPVKVKDVVIIVTGLSFTILSLFTTVQDLVTRN